VHRFISFILLVTELYEIHSFQSFSMTTSSSDIDFTKVFTYAKLTPVLGKPRYEDIALSQREIYACASSVRSTRGGGNHGELGLSMTVTAYQLVAPNTPYIRPVNPGQLQQPPNATQFQIGENRRLHDLAVGEFHIVNTLERQLINLLLSAYDRQWLNQITHPLTGAVNKTIPQIFEQLYRQYGQITPQILDTKRADTANLSYNANEPIDQVWTKINDYSLMSHAANTPATSQQLINIGQVILQRAGCFVSDIRAWNARPPAQQTWNNFQVHFSDAQRDLALAQPLTSSMGFLAQSNSAEEIANNVILKLREEANQMQPPGDEQFNGYYDHNHEAAAAAMQHQMQSDQANAAQASNMHTTIANLQAQIQQLQVHLQQAPPPMPVASYAAPYNPPYPPPAQHQHPPMHQQHPFPTQPPYPSQSFHQQGNGGRGRSSGRGAPRGGRGTPRGGRGGRGGRTNVNPTQRPTHYCWTHGCKGHASSDCRNPAPNHQWGATFQHMMNGNTDGCFWLNP
jgi:hypothetical protein